LGRASPRIGEGPGLGITIVQLPIAGESALPPGGSPAGDAAYLWWAKTSCERANAYWIDLWADRNTGELPPEIGDIINVWQLTNHLFKYTFGGALPAGRWPNFRHKIRAVAVQYHLRKDEFGREFRVYCRRLADEFRAENPHLSDEG